MVEQYIINIQKQKGGPKVFDVTTYLDDHPGGAEVMLDVSGQDATEFLGGNVVFTRF